MVAKQDLDLIAAKFEASIEKTARRSRLWIIGSVFLASALIVAATGAAVKLF